MGDLFTSTARRISNSPVGLGVGLVGVTDGFRDGFSVGATEIDGTNVGVRDGKVDGDAVGETTGLLVGEPGVIGAEVGALEGARVGALEGACVGDDVVGINVG
jgi:hypothetical protein